ncbi:hypothetical protein PHET_01515 [Paragonimus heterotremus]|uniref:Uncharacterized protein n=1 Tax=Paragonimus heterotremus TaxID=100268 RepID=A0A8J4SSA6_9TREM|nr:hypothetical protein PHET_01515 [Paragonimus heterotremus]
MSMVSSFASHMMHVNPRSVLRPEYFDYSSLRTSASRCKLQPVDKRYNTNTAPVYSLDNPCPPRKRPCRRPYGRLFFGSSMTPADHPYMHSSPDVLPHCSASCLPTNVHPAARHSASTVPVRNYLSSPDSDALSRIESNSPCSTVTSKYSPDSTTQGCNKSNVTPAKQERGDIPASNRSYAHGQAEQLRRSRESNTFALIDTQLSRAPLNQVRDMYLQSRSGFNSSSGNSTARSTKKVNLSVVHTIVRFRIKEYLRDLQDHVQRLLDRIFSNMFDEYKTEMRNELASKVFGMNRLPCSDDCQFCSDLVDQVKIVRGHSDRLAGFRDRLCRPSFPSPIDTSVRPLSNSSNSSTTPMLSASDIPSDCQDFSPSDNRTDRFDADYPNTVFNDFSLPLDTLSRELPSDTNAVRLSPNHFDIPPSDPVLEKPLPSYHMNNDAPDSKPHSRSRLDSFSLRIVDDFTSNDWSAEFDFGPCGEEPVDLHTLVNDSAPEHLGIRTEEFFDPAFEPIDLMHQFAIDRFPNLNFAGNS